MTTAPTRQLLEGSEAIADAMIAGGCRFFAGYPMTPFTEVLEHMAGQASRRRRRVHERRERARGGRHGVGRRRDRHPCRDRVDRPGAVAHAGVARRDLRWRGCRSSSSTWPARRATTSRPRGAAATATTARSCWRRWTCPRRSSSCSSRSISTRRSGATRCCSSATTTSRTRTQSVDVEPIDFGPLPPNGLGARRLHRRLPAARRLVSPLGHRQAARRRRLRPRRALSRRRGRDRRDAGRRRAAGRDRVRRRRRRRRRRVRHARRSTCAPRCAACAPTARRSATSGRSRSWPFPTRAVRRRGRAVRGLVAVYENNQGQMIDDVRLAVLGRCAGASSSAASASTARASGSRPISTSPTLRVPRIRGGPPSC